METSIIIDTSLTQENFRNLGKVTRFDDYSSSRLKVIVHQSQREHNVPPSPPPGRIGLTGIIYLVTGQVLDGNLAREEPQNPVTLKDRMTHFYLFRPQSTTIDYSTSQ